VRQPLLQALQAFPSESTLGEVVLHPPSPAGLFIYRLWGSAPFPALQWNPHQDSHCYKLSWSKVARWGPPLLPSQAGLLIYSSVRDCPSHTRWSSGWHALFATCLFVVVYYSVFFLFFAWVGLVCLGGYADLAQGCLWEYHVPLSSPGGLLLSSQ
jgi:hypothetical protein